MVSNSEVFYEKNIDQTGPDSFRACVFLLSGCQTRTIVPEEVLQLPTHAAVYTAYNLWYENPENLTTDNIQKGTLIPFGTEVRILSMTDSSIVFQANGKTFTLHYDDGRTMMPMKSLPNSFSPTSVAVETAGGVSPAAFEKMRRGIIEKGMTKQNVITTYGPPSKIRTPNQLSDSGSTGWTGSKANE